jgi:hypothetical protein
MLTSILFITIALGLSAAAHRIRRTLLRKQQYQYCRCPDCGQKLRYLAAKAGRPALCPLCRRRLTLPRRREELSPALDASGGYQVRLSPRGLTVLAAQKANRPAVSKEASIP